jgi:hypothetical protein
VEVATETAGKKRASILENTTTKETGRGGVFSRATMRAMDKAEKGITKAPSSDKASMIEEHFAVSKQFMVAITKKNDDSTTKDLLNTAISNIKSNIYVPSYLRVQGYDVCKFN